MSKSASYSNSPSAAADRPVVRPRRRIRPFRLVFLLLVIALASLFQPDCFRFAVRQFLSFEAWRNGVNAQIGAVEGSLFEPVVVRDSVWAYEGENGPITRLEVKTATATFAWRNLLPRRSGQWFQRLTLETVTGKMELPAVADTPAPPPAFAFHLPRPRGRWLASPAHFEAEDVDFIVASGADYVRLLQTRLTLSNLETGSIAAGQILVKEPWLTRTFRQVTGTTAIQDGTLQIAALTLEPGVEIQDFSVSIDSLAHGQMKIALELAAFGGDLRLDAQTLPDEPQFTIDVAGPFSQIDVAKLAIFLGVSDAAGGTIKNGNFSFRGPPQQFAKASAQLRFEAENFQWETRQWDSLVFGAKLLNGRIQIPKLALTQGHNWLSLSGDMALPMPGVAWWKSEFSCDVEARIENLTELSALVLPDFKYAAGRASIDGSIRGKDQQFTGQLLVSGTDLRWRNAPIERLNASVRLNGNEYQITNVSILNGADYVNGSGVVNIVGDKQYWGELRGSVEDLAKYRAILQKPVVPESLAGGALIDWSGEGSAKGHSGKFLARLRKVRSLGASAALLHPIDADFEGTYSNGGMVFSGFALSDDESSFTASVSVVNKAVSLRGIRLMHRQALWLEGNAVLPLDLWNAWPNTSLAKLLDDATPGHLDLTAYDLSLNETARLSGLKFPIEGVVRGHLAADGPLGALKTEGHLTLSKGHLPLGWSGEALSGVEASGTFEGQTLHVEKFAGQHPTGDFAASGDVDFTNLRDPSLKLVVNSARSRFHLFPAAEGTSGLTADAALALQLNGPVSAGKISGDAKLLAVALPALDGAAWTRLLMEDREGNLPLVLTAPSYFGKAWQFDIQGTADKAGSTPVVSADLRLKGTSAAPALVGQAALLFPPTSAVSTRGRSGGESSVLSSRDLTLLSATFDFVDGFPGNPVISAEATGSLPGNDLGEQYTLYLTGTLPNPMRTFVFAPPLTEKAIRAALGGETAAKYFSGESRFSLLVPADLREDVEITDWPDIQAEPAPAESPAPEPTPAPAPGTPQ